MLQRIFLNNNFFGPNNYIQINLKKISLLESQYNTKKYNNFDFDFDFFDNKYLLYLSSYKNFLNKIYLFKLQNQIEFNKIIKSYKQLDYDLLANHILNNILNLSDKIIALLVK